MCVTIVSLQLPASSYSEASSHRGRRSDEYFHNIHCSAEVQVVNLYPSHEHLVQVVFPNHNFAALEYEEHTKAVFDIGMSDEFEVSLLSKNGSKYRYTVPCLSASMGD